MTESMTIFVIAMMAFAVVWATIGFLVLGRVVNVHWALLAPLAVAPVSVLATITVLVVMRFGGFGTYTWVITPLVFASVLFPWPVLIIVMVRSARRLLMQDGRVVAEVFE